MTQSHTLIETAAHLECLLPKLMRRLFTLDPDHPVSELPVAQLRLCAMLQGGPRAISSICEEIDISASAVTQIADRLERAGLIERVAEQDDRRMKNLQLTPYGAQLMASRREQRVHRVAETLEALSPEDRDAVLAAVQMLLDAATVTHHHSDTEAVPVARLSL